VRTRSASAAASDDLGGPDHLVGEQRRHGLRILHRDVRLGHLRGGDRGPVGTAHPRRHRQAEHVFALGEGRVEDLDEGARGRLRGGGGLVRLGQLLEELLVVDVAAVGERLHPEAHTQRNQDHAVLLEPGVGEITTGVGDDQGAVGRSHSAEYGSAPRAAPAARSRCPGAWP